MSDDQPGLPDLSQLLGGLGGGGDGEEGGFGGLGGLFAQAQAAMAASQAAAEAEVEGTAGGGVVRIRATGSGEVLSVRIAPEAVDPDDVEGLEDLVLAALRDVQASIAELHAEAMGGLDPSSMLGGLSGVFGGPSDDVIDVDDPGDADDDTSEPR